MRQTQAIGRVKLLGLLLLTLILGACSTAGQSQTGEQAGSGLGLASQAEAAGRLVVYSGRSESLVGPIIEQFEVATGLNVDVKYGSTGEIAATLLEEGENSPADLFFAQDPGGLGAIAKAGMFANVPDSILSTVPEWARSPNSKWIGISGRARVVVFNSEAVSSENLPQSLDDLTDPKWKGKIGWAPTNGSFQTMVTAMRVLWGEAKTREWLQAIKDNDPKAFPKNTPIVAAAGSGEIEVGLVNHYYLHRFLQEEGEDFGARNHYLNDDGPGSLIMVSGVGILDTSENVENAEKFIKFLLSTPAQQYFAVQTFEYPLVEGVTVHRLLTPLDQIKKPTIDMAALDDIEGTQALLRDIGIIE